jgi:hypothetical protein
MPQIILHFRQHLLDLLLNEHPQKTFASIQKNRLRQCIKREALLLPPLLLTSQQFRHTFLFFTRPSCLLFLCSTLLLLSRPTCLLFSSLALSLLTRSAFLLFLGCALLLFLGKPLLIILGKAHTLCW